MAESNSPGAGGSQGEQASQDPFSEGVDRLRETAKWIITIFAAIGATLTAGTQLSNIGQFSFGDWRLWVAVVAATIAFIAIGGVIWLAVRVLIGGRTSIDELVEQISSDPQSGDAKFVDAQPQLRAGFSSVKALRDEYNKTIVAREKANKDSDQSKFNFHNGRLIYLDGVINRLLLALRYDKVFRIFKVASIIILGLGFVAAFAIMTFVWAANPPEAPAAEETTMISDTDETPPDTPPAKESTEASSKGTDEHITLTQQPSVCIVNANIGIGGADGMETTIVRKATSGVGLCEGK